MSEFRVSKSIIENANKFGAYGTNSLAADPRQGTQLGVGYNAANIDAATPLVFRPTYFIVIHLPTMYDENPEFGQMLKTIIEGCPKQISGVDFNYTLGTQKTPAGFDGQELAVPTKTTRSNVNPTMVFQEVTGNLIWNVFKQWIFDINDPDTNASMAHVVGGPQNFVSSAYSMTMLGIQFDPSMLPENIIGAAMYTNMVPTTTDNFGFERNIGQTSIRERSIQFEAIVRENAYVTNLAVQVASALNLHKADYRYAVPEFVFDSSKVNSNQGGGAFYDSAVASSYASTNSAHDATVNA